MATPFSSRLRKFRDTSFLLAAELDDRKVAIVRRLRCASSREISVRPAALWTAKFSMASPARRTFLLFFKKGLEGCGEPFLKRFPPPSSFHILTMKSFGRSAGRAMLTWLAVYLVGTLCLPTAAGVFSAKTYPSVPEADGALDALACRLMK